VNDARLPGVHWVSKSLNSSAIAASPNRQDQTERQYYSRDHRPYSKQQDLILHEIHPLHLGIYRALAHQAFYTALVNKGLKLVKSLDQVKYQGNAQEYNGYLPYFFIRQQGIRQQKEVPKQGNKADDHNDIEVIKREVADIKIDG